MTQSINLQQTKKKRIKTSKESKSQRVTQNIAKSRKNLRSAKNNKASAPSVHKGQQKAARRRKIRI